MLNAQMNNPTISLSQSAFDEFAEKVVSREMGRVAGGGQVVFLPGLHVVSEAHEKRMVEAAQHCAQNGQTVDPKYLKHQPRPIRVHLKWAPLTMDFMADHVEQLHDERIGYSVLAREPEYGGLKEVGFIDAGSFAAWQYL